jgi:hypothetical protein
MVCFADGEKKRLAREFITKPESVAVELGDITVKNHASHRFVQIPGQRLEIALEAMSMLLQPGAGQGTAEYCKVVNDSFTIADLMLAKAKEESNDDANA